MSFSKHDRVQLNRIRQFRVNSGVTSEAIYLYLKALDCPRALAVWMLYQNGEHEQLAELVFDPLHYISFVGLRDSYAATAFLSKHRALKLPYDLDERALAKFELFEHACMNTNIRFRTLSSQPGFSGRNVWLHNAVIRKIEEILGDVDFEAILRVANWGPGATTLIKARYASATNKFQCETGITRQLFDLFPPELFREYYPLWAKQLESRDDFPTIQVGNKIVTVPKDATANRVIAIEPGLNIWFQLAIGKVIQQRLKRCGVDLRKQDKNQWLAKQGSIACKLATIDFSSASDSISCELVRAILPPRWFALLDACRSHYGSQGDSQKRWEKFSSMGNGFTFALESLIFYAAASSCAEYLQVPSGLDGTVSVYGDDVIIPVVCLGAFSEICKLYGFTLNGKKSHYSSTFRESCGKHYVSGVDVTPIYLKDKLLDIPSVYRLANAIRRLAHRRGLNLCCDVKLRVVYDYLVSVVPQTLRLRIADSLGDGGFISNFDESTPVRAKRGFEGFLVKHVVDVGKPHGVAVEGLLLDRLWALTRASPVIGELESRAMDCELHLTHPTLRLTEISGLVPKTGNTTRAKGNFVTFRGDKELKLALSLVAQWDDLGPWL